MLQPRPSALYRLGQVLRVLAILALVFLVLFLATVAYSAVELGEGIARQSGSLQHSDSASFVGTSVVVNVTFPLRNDGYYNVRGLTLVAIFTNDTIQSAPIAVTETAVPVNIPGHGSSTVTLLTDFDVANPAGPFLLLNDANIYGTLFLNASYAAVIPVNLEVGFLYHWGAPFANLTYNVGTPTPLSNGTVAIPVTVHFENHTPGLSLVGTVNAVVTESNGTACTRQSFPVHTTEGPVTLMETFFAPEDCQLSGATLTSSFVGSGFDIPLPTETLP